MKCPKCGQKWWVSESRHADSRPFATAETLIKEAEEVVGWYTADWTVRRRSCSCGFIRVTIEVTTEDLAAMIAERVAETCGRPGG